MGELVEVVRDEFARAADELPSEREVDRAKAQLKAGLLMSLESSAARAEQMARQLLAFDRQHHRRRADRAGRGVTPQAVRDIAAALVTGSPTSLALVGAGARTARRMRTGRARGQLAHGRER